MKTIFTRILLIILITPMICTSFQASAQENSIYQFTVQDIDGNDFLLSELKGKKVMLVNTASKCGLTPQYKQLQELFTEYKSHNFIIIGFPANNFMTQEPGSNEEIKSFCQKNYGVTFPMMSKISVKGKDIHPLYKWLTQKEYNKVQDAPVEWNFQKFLIGKTGQLEKVVAPHIKPNDEEIVKWITQ